MTIVVDAQPFDSLMNLTETFYCEEYEICIKAKKKSNRAISPRAAAATVVGKQLTLLSN